MVFPSRQVCLGNRVEAFDTSVSSISMARRHYRENDLR